MKNHFEIKVTGSNPCTPMPVHTEIKVCGLPANEVMSESLIRNIEAKTNKPLPAELSLERVKQALTAIVELRVHQVRGVRPKADVEWKDIRYPAFLWPFLRSIGDVVSIEDAIEMKVVFPDSVELSGTRYVTRRSEDYWAESLKTLSLLVAYGSTCGLEIATAFPKEKDGQASVLAFTEVSGMLMSHVSGKPLSEGLLRAAFDLRFTEYVWGSIRWEYQRVSWYHSRLSYVVQDAFRGD